jgi:hypothetical protein
MTDLHHPITPPPELVLQWLEDGPEDGELGISKHIATQAARWGANQELEACLEHLFRRGFYDADILCLRAARRPKPPSLKEQALEELEKVDMLWDTTEFSQETLNSLDTIRRALEQLND